MTGLLARRRARRDDQNAAVDNDADDWLALLKEDTPARCWCADPGRTENEMYQCPAGDAGEDCLAHDYLAVGGALGYGLDPRTPIPDLRDFQDAISAAPARPAGAHPYNRPQGTRDAGGLTVPESRPA
ncbi:hypothetical protein ACIBKY_53450 [Nonomuraea sp. NPDC050394]|uniref:hypothetical protein n=1 Tax=Nonomuraea sp. NPDC050394 TaxID=3364363 RepID=UPI0037AFC92B